MNILLIEVLQLLNKGVRELEYDHMKYLCQEIKPESDQTWTPQSQSSGNTESHEDANSKQRLRACYRTRSGSLNTYIVRKREKRTEQGTSASGKAWFMFRSWSKLLQSVEHNQVNMDMKYQRLFIIVLYYDILCYYHILPYKVININTIKKQLLNFRCHSGVTVVFY